MSKIKSSSGDDKHPYTRQSFWNNTSNHFWETDYYTPKAKEYFRQWLQDQRQGERRLTNLGKAA